MLLFAKSLVADAIKVHAKLNSLLYAVRIVVLIILQASKSDKAGYCFSSDCLYVCVHAKTEKLLVLIRC